jgi:hypothetical protein
MDRCFGYLNEQGHDASSQLSDALSLLLESDISSLDSKLIRDILQAFKSKVDDVADQIKTKDIESFQVKNNFGFAEKDKEYLKAELEANSRQI